jgi:Zn-dependent protease with chaperone function
VGRSAPRPDGPVQLLAGGGRDDRGVGAIIAIILALIAALVIQLAVSRGREYGADAPALS